MARRSYPTPEQTRIRLGLSQAAFWGVLGCSQSAGSRWEAGDRRIPGPVDILYRAVYLGHPLPKVPQ